MASYHIIIAVVISVISIIIKILSYLFLVGFVNTNFNIYLVLALESTTLMLLHFPITNNMTFKNLTISSSVFQNFTMIQKDSFLINGYQINVDFKGVQANKFAYSRFHTFPVC